MSRVLARVLKEFLPVFSTAFDSARSPTHDASGAPQLPWIHRTLLDTLGEC